MQNDELTPKESIDLINEMIDGAKARMNENGFIFLFWGWLIIICAVSQLILLQMGYYEINFYPYFLAIPGGIYTAIIESRKTRHKNSAYYTDTVMSGLWITAGVNIFIIAFIFSPVLKMSPVPFILIILALATVVSGTVIKFKPLIWGGIVCNAAGIASVFIPYSYDPLLVIIAILAADLFPGYILRSKYKKTYA